MRLSQRAKANQSVVVPRRPDQFSWVKLTALLLLALWLPATSHAWLESSGIIHHGGHHGPPNGHGADVDHDEHEDHDDLDINHDAADGICRIETDAVAVPPPVLIADFLPLLAAHIGALLRGPDAAAAPAFVPSTAPPELHAARHFCERTASPARAPDVTA